MAETKAHNLRIPADLWAALVARAAVEHTTVTALVIRAVVAYLR